MYENWAEPHNFVIHWARKNVVFDKNLFALAVRNI